MEYLNKNNIPLVLFVLLSVRSLAVFDYSQALALISVSAVYAYGLYLESKKVAPLDEEVRKELEAMKNTVSNMNVRGVKPIALNPEKKSYF